MTALERKEKRRSMVRREVIAAAVKLIKKEGVEALTLRKLAELLNYSPAALYEYFSSKDQIIYALRQQMLKELMKLLNKINPELAPEPYLRAICMEMLNYGLKEENHRILSLPLPNELLKEIPEVLIELRHLLDAALQRLQLPGLANYEQRRLAIFILRSYLEGAASIALRGEIPTDLGTLEENTQKVLTLFLNGWSKK